MSTQSYSSVFGVVKLQTDDAISAAGNHNLRNFFHPRNADPARLADNIYYHGSKDSDILALVNNRIAAAGITKVRKNALKAIELIYSAGPEFFKKIKSRDDWVKDCLAHAYREFGKENVVFSILHLDETTPHLHVIVVPIREAKYEDGRKYKTHKKNKSKLDSKGLFEQCAHARQHGPVDKKACEFKLTDFTDAFAIIQKLIAKGNPVSNFFAKHFTSEAYQFLTDSKKKLIEKKPVLRAELNKILAHELIFDPAIWEKEKLSNGTRLAMDGYPVGDKLYVANRKLLEDLLGNAIKKCIGRPLCGPSAPYMHHLQETNYELCHKLDPEISVPLYETKIEHESLAKWNADRLRAIQNVTPNAEFELTPPTEEDVKNPGKYIDRELDRLNDIAEKAVDPLIAQASENELLHIQIEKLKAGMRNEHASHERKIMGVVTENAALKDEIAALKAQKADYLQRMRSIPLDQVLAKLGYNQRVPGKENQFHLPDDRIIEINGRSFSDCTGRHGLGQLSNRKGAKGAVDLTMFVTGWDLPLTQKWLKDNFDLGAALNESVERLKGELEPELEKNITADQSKAFAIQRRSPLQPDADQWIHVKQSLAVDYGLEPQLLDDLQRASLIDANQHGALVCIKQSQKQFVGGIALGLKSNPITKTTSFYETLEGDGFPFALGDPQSTYSAIVASPVEAIAFYQLCCRNCYVLATKAVLPPAILDGLKKRNPETSHPVLIAHDLSDEGDALAKKMKINLHQAGIKNELHRPPKFHDHANSWVDLILAVSGKLKKFVGISAEAVSGVVEQCKNIFDMFTPSSFSDPKKREK